ncbi:MAG: NADPH-dependent F420 reductase [Vulcanimicrobiaceae bacterium]
MNIGILGSGPMARILGAAWAADNHNVMFGFDDVAAASARAAPVPRVTNGTYSEAAAFGEAVLLACPWRVALDALPTLRDALAGKIIVDCVNPVDDSGMLAVGCTTSFAETVAETVHGAKVVKAFSTVTPETLEYVLKKDAPVIDGQQVTVLYCGDDDSSKRIAAGLIDELKLEPIDAGGLKEARLIEPAGALAEQLRRSARVGTVIAMNVAHELSEHAPIDRFL